MSTRILIVYHSQTGNTERLARAVAEGAASVEGAAAILKRAGDATLEDLLSADGLALGTPEYFGYLSGMVKDFLDRTYTGAGNRVFRKPYALFVSAGNDGEGAVRAAERIALGFKLKKVCEPVICRGEPAAPLLERCRELGATLAAGCQLGIY